MLDEGASDLHGRSCAPPSQQPPADTSDLWPCSKVCPVGGAINPQRNSCGASYQHAARPSCSHTLAVRQHHTAATTDTVHLVLRLMPCHTCLSLLRYPLAFGYAAPAAVLARTPTKAPTPAPTFGLTPAPQPAPTPAPNPAPTAAPVPSPPPPPGEPGGLNSSQQDRLA